MPGTVTLFDPQGALRDVPAEQAGDYIARGWRPQTQADVLAQAGAAANRADYGGVRGAIGAAAAGLARGATLGLSDVAARAIGGDEAADTLRGLRAENPTLSTAADIAGAFAPAVLTGGSALPAGIAGDLGRGVAAAAGGGFRGAALGGAAEGALYGLGGGISELAMSTDPLTVEHAASVLSSNVLYGAGAGAAGGAAFHGLAKGLSAAKGAIDDALVSRSADRAMQAVDQLDAAAAAEPANITPETDLTTLDKAGLKAAREQELEQLKSARVPERQKFATDLGEFYNTMAEQKLSKVVTGTADAEARRAGAALSSADKQLRRLTDNEIGLTENPERALNALQTQRQALADIREWMDEEMSQWANKVREAKPQIYRDLMENKIEGYVGSSLTPAGRERAVSQELLRRFGGRLDESAEGSFALDYPAKISLDRFEQVKSAIDRNEALQHQLARVTAEPVSERLMLIDAAERALGARTSAPTPVPHESPIGTLLKAAGHAAGPLGSVASTAMGAIGAVKKFAGAAAERLGRAASDFLGKASKAVRTVEPAAPVLATKVLAQLRYGDRRDTAAAESPQKQRALPELYKARADEIRHQVQIAADGTYQMRPEARQKMAAKLSGLGAVDPMTADRLESAGARRIAWLASQLPRRPDVMAVQVGPDTYTPSDIAMRTWARKAAAADDPVGVLERAARGRISPAEVMTLRALYPEMLASFVNSIVPELATLPKKLPYERRLALSMLTGQPIDPATHPAILRELQSMYTSEPGTAGGTQEPAAQPQFGSVKRSDPGTPAQRREGMST